MKSPEQQAQEMKTLHNIAFEPMIKDGAVIGYKSSDSTRKIIKLHVDSPKPIPGNLYEVEVLDDTDPDDPTKGQYTVSIKESAEVITQVGIDHWKEIDENITEADKVKRASNQAAMAKTTLEEMGKKKESSGINPRLEKKFGSKKTSVNSFLSDAIKKAKEEHASYERYYREYLSMDGEGKPEKGFERAFANNESLISLRKKNLKDSIEKIIYLENQLEEFKRYKDEMQESFVEKSAKNQIITEVELKTYRDLQDKIEEIESLIEAETLVSPEAWYGYHVRELKEYRDQFSKGRIVETPSVKAKAEKLTDILMSGQPVFIHGHLGSGKTELARYICTNKLGKEYHMISGSKHMSPSEIYGHDILTVSGEKNEDEKDLSYEEKVEGRLREWAVENKEMLESLSIEEREGERNRVQDRIIASLEAGATISEYYTGPIYRAMENGEPLIIDELNAIPHDILIGLNDLLTRRPGNTVKIQQDSSREITVAKGFCVIMTGNLNTGDLKKYVDRNELDSAFVNRLHSEEYDYLPQRKEGKADEADASDELYTLMVVMTMDRQANLKLPEGSLEKMWHLAEASRIFQDVFSGKQIKDKYYFQKTGVNTSKEPKLNSTVMSLRNIKRIFDSWRNDGFSKELDFYLYENFVATSTDPNDKAYIYQILQKQFGFFKSEGWEQNPTYGDGKHSLSTFEVSVPKNALKRPIGFWSPRETIDIVYGKKAPERKVWPRMEADSGQEGLEDGKEKIRQEWSELEGKLRFKESKEGEISMEEAEKIMGDQFLGPKLITEVFGFSIEVKSVPSIPFSKEEIKAAKARGEELILHTSLISMDEMNEIRKEKVADGSKLLYDTDWYKNEEFYKKGFASPMEWKLTSKEVIPGTTSENYLDQTQALITHLTTEIFKGIAPKDYPKEYQVAFKEFSDKKDKIAELLKSDWKIAAEELEKLKITSLTRETPAEVLYRLILSEKKTGTKPLPSTYSWTSRRSSGGHFVLVGDFDSGGVIVDYAAPGRTLSDLGACLSRRG